MNNLTFLQFIFIINPKYWIWIPRFASIKTCPFQISFLFLIVSYVDTTQKQAEKLSDNLQNIENEPD